eukprot:RCo044916
MFFPTLGGNDTFDTSVDFGTDFLNSIRFHVVQNLHGSTVLSRVLSTGWSRHFHGEIPLQCYGYVIIVNCRAHIMATFNSKLHLPKENLQQFLWCSSQMARVNIDVANDSIPATALQLPRAY